ncbi:MAG: tetratricopeptide repeat protein [Campylobacterota bacterium]|nr:tetratricopeptide repeat protein [Campylobacterota bacterium]
MSVFQLLMLGASAFFAFKIYEHIQTLQEPDLRDDDFSNNEPRSAGAFSVFSPEALVLKADEAYEEEDFQRALALLNEVNEKEANNSEVLFKIAYILQKVDDNDEALKYYKEALALDKNNEFIHNSMATIYRVNGEFTSAKMHLQTSLEIDNQNPITYYNFGNLLVEMQHNEEAVAMYEKAIEIDPKFGEAKVELEKLQGE